MYTTATYVAQALTFLAGLIQKGLLGPEGTGYWALMGTAWSFFAVTSLGVVNGAVRQIPHYRGLQQYDRAAATADTAFTFSQLTMAATGAALCCVAVALGTDWPPELRWGLVLLGLTAPLRNLVDCYVTLLQGTRRFAPLSAALVLQAAIVLTVQSALVLVFGFYGMFAGLVVLNLATLFLWRKFGVSGPSNPAFRRSIQRTQLRDLVQVGLPLYVYSHTWLLFIAVDSLIVARYLGVTDLGYYALAISVTTYIVLLPKSVATVLFPRMQERYSSAGNLASVRDYAAGAQLVLAFMIVPAMIAAAYFLLPVLIRHALPSFEPAIDVIHIMVIGSFAIALVEMPIQLVITIGRRWHLSAITLGALMLNALANYWAVVVIDADIEGAAYATVLSYVVFLIVVTGYGVGAGGAWRSALRQLIAIVSIAAWTLIAVRVVDGVLSAQDQSTAADVAINVIKVIVTWVSLTPWIVYVQRRYGAVSLLRESVGSVFGARWERRPTE